MRKILTLAIFFFIAANASAQDVFIEYLEYDKVVTIQPYYSKNQTPGAHARYFGIKSAFVKRVPLLEGDGYRDPYIGLLLNPSLNWAPFHLEKSEIRNVLLQDGLLNVHPTLFIKVLPDLSSKLRLFATAGGGLKLFPKLRDIDATSSDAFVDTDDDNGLFEQFCVHAGGGLDYDNGRAAVQVNFVRGWHDVTKTTEIYYKKYINPSTTFVRYATVRANFRIGGCVSAYLEWRGYRESFDYERVLLGGVLVNVGFDGTTK